MKLKQNLEEFAAIAFVVMMIAFFALAAQVHGQETTEPIDPLSKPLEEEPVRPDPLTPPLEVVEAENQVILNPGTTVVQGGANPVYLKDGVLVKTKLTAKERIAGAVVKETTQVTVDGPDLSRVATLRDSLNVIDTERGAKILLEADILFDFDKSKVKPSAAGTLGDVAELIALSQDREVEVVGYADHIGNDKYNLSLSWDRANAVIDHLVTKENLPRQQFRAVGRGEEGAEAPNTKPDGSDNPEGRQENRRVEILIRNGIDASPEKPGPELN